MLCNTQEDGTFAVGVGARGGALCVGVRVALPGGPRAAAAAQASKAVVESLGTYIQQWEIKSASGRSIS